MSSVWGVYTQYEPTYKYEEHLESIWSTKDKALLEANSIDLTKHNDHVWVQEIKLDTKYQNYEKLENIVCKSPRRG